jgi:hypothetical protein
MKTLTLLVAVTCVAGLPALPMAGATEDDVLTAVCSSAYNGYVRTRRPDGSLKPESYAFGQGEYSNGQMRDDSIDAFPFRRLAGLLAPYLARQNYVPTQAPEGTDLLIVVHWGTTIPYDNGSYRMALDNLKSAMGAGRMASQSAVAPQLGQRSSMAALGGDTSAALRGMQSDDLGGYLMMLELQNHLRDQANARNAALLGYLPEMARVDETMRFAGLGTYYNDLASDLEEDRYYVILAAYDFQRAWRQKQLKLLWVTRVSIRAHGNRFDQDAEAMIRCASRYFGQTSLGLLRQRVPEGRVDVGEPRVIGVVPDAGR